jgi:membrane protein implicated in regulation of membrane protease activity
MPEFTILWWHWCVAGLALLGLEIFLPGNVIMWFGLGALVAGGIAYAVPLAGWETQSVVFIALSFACLFLGRRLIRKAAPEPGPVLNRRLAQYVGRTAKVVEAISEGRGKIQLGDTRWLVRGPDAPVGAEVTVLRVEGSDMFVEILEK